MSKQPQRVYCPRCKCAMPAYKRGWSEGSPYDGNLRCSSCREPFPGAEIEAAKAAVAGWDALTPKEANRATFIRYEVEITGAWTDFPGRKQKDGVMA